MNDWLILNLARSELAPVIMTFELNWRFQLQGWSLCRFPDVLICQSLWNKNPSDLGLPEMDTFVDGGNKFQRITSLGHLVEFIKGMKYNPLWIYEIDYYGGNPIFSNNYSRMAWESPRRNCIRLIFPILWKCQDQHPLFSVFIYQNFQGV